jgi:hypothetical protein
MLFHLIWLENNFLKASVLPGVGAKILATVLSDRSQLRQLLVWRMG